MTTTRTCSPKALTSTGRCFSMKWRRLWLHFPDRILRLTKYALNSFREVAQGRETWEAAQVRKQPTAKNTLR